jgi:hypothetical protein
MGRLSISFIEEKETTQSEYIIIPRVSSENRKYIQLVILQEDVIVSDSAISYQMQLFTTLVY